MLKRKERLTKAEFALYFRTGRRYHTPYFQVVCAKHTSLHASVVVPKKVVQKAAKRTIVRRRLYDIIRTYTRATGTHGVFIVIMKPPGVTATFETLKEELHTTIKACVGQHGHTR